MYFPQAIKESNVQLLEPFTQLEVCEHLQFLVLLAVDHTFTITRYITCQSLHLPIQFCKFCAISSILQVSVPDNLLGVVLADLTSNRRAQIQEVTTLDDGKLVSALVPLACLMVRFPIPALPHRFLFSLTSLLQLGASPWGKPGYNLVLADINNYYLPLLPEQLLR